MRPEFITPEDFRAWLPLSQLNKIAMIGGITPVGYIGRCEREGRPIRHLIHNGSKRWRLLEICARAKANCHAITPPKAAQIEQEIESLKKERERLRVEVEGIKHQLRLQPLSTELTGATLLTKEEIACGKMDLPCESGVYFLLLGDEIVYVGQSVNIYTRVTQHLATKNFDGFAYIPCAKDSLDVLESLYIHVLRPKHNGRWQSAAGMCAPLRLDELISLSTQKKQRLEVKNERTNTASR